MSILYKYIVWSYTMEGEELFKVKGNVSIRTNAHKLAANKFKLESRRRFLTIREVRPWNRLPIAAVG